MLDSALGISFVALIVATLLLMAAGRPPLGRRWVRPIFVAGCTVAGAVGAGGAWPTAIAVAVATGLISVSVPRAWTAIGATFFATLLATAVLYSAYLAYAALLLGGDPSRLSSVPFCS